MRTASHPRPGSSSSRGKTAKSGKSQRPSFEHIALVYRSHSPKAVALAKEIVQWLHQKNVEVSTAPDQKIIPKTRRLSAGQLNSLSLVLVLGGDGTYLRAVRLLRGHSVPVLGFNMGSLGFLTSTSVEIFETLEKLLRGDMVLRERSMLEAQIYCRGKLRHESQALNDVVIERGSYSQLINTSIASDDFLVSQVKADGLIVSTPTGSTAYNLAAGGPLLDPEVQALILTPVAPHSLTSRPLIFPIERKLSFRLEGKMQRAHFIVDGQKETEITPEDEVFIYQSQQKHLMLQAKNYNYFHVLREKLKFGDRA